MKLTRLLILGFILLSCEGILSLNPPKQQTYNINWNDSPKYVNGDIAFIQQTDYSIYATYDGGVTWNLIPNVKAQEIILDSVDPNLVLFKGQNSLGVGVTYYRSVDGGKTFQTISLSFPLNGIKPHPVQSKLLLAHSGKTVYYSTNFGLEWLVGFSGYNLYSKQNLGTSPVWDTQTSSIYAILYLNSKATLVKSSDFGKTQTTVLDNAGTLVASNNYIFVGTYNAEEDDLSLYVRSSQSPVSNNADGFLECEFPFGEEIQPNEYTIIDDSSGAVWLGVKLKQASHWGSMYVSDTTGSQYTTVMPHVNHGLAYDFTPFYGVPGVFMGNNLTNWQSQASKPTQVQSLISYDNGGAWFTLTPPVDMPCANPGCSLNLHGISAFADDSRGYGPFYSIPNAPGVAIATGTVNPILSSQPIQSNIKTFLSRDTGKTWKRIFDTGSIYEFGNYGNFIVLADCLQDTNSIYYSIDGGDSFTQFNLTQAYDIINIVTAPDNSGMKFVLLAQDSLDRGVIITLDFTVVGYPTCQSTDYININVTGKTSNGCILGEINTFSVRNPSSQCLVNTEPFSASAFSCECTIDDYECDLGYTEIVDTPTSLICGVDPTFVTPNVVSQCPAGSTKSVTKGYRKVAGSQCTGGVSSQFDPDTIQCPGSESPKSKGWVAAVVIIVLLVVFGGAGFFIYRNPILREKVRKLIGMNRGPKYSVVGIKPNSLADDEFGIEDDDAQILNDNDLQDNF